MNMDLARSRRRTGRQGTRERQPDAVLSVMLAQITVCLILLALAYCVKISGLTIFQSARVQAKELLDAEMDLNALNQTLRQWNVEVPVWLGQYAPLTEGSAASQPTVPAESAQGAVDSQDAASSEPTRPLDITAQADQPAASGLDDALEEYINQYLPAEGDAPILPALPPEENDVADQGQGGGVNPVRMVSKRLQAPGGTTLAPFFLTKSPILPVKYGTLTCTFGFRTHPITGKEDFHTGVDIAAPEAASISAVLGGTVSEVGESPFYGNYIVIQHSSGLETAYCHCSQILAPVGAVVKQREVIARVGSTGMSTGSHVHLEFRINGQQANPAWVYDEF